MVLTTEDDRTTLVSNPPTFAAGTAFVDDFAEDALHRCVLRGVPAPATAEDVLASLRAAGHVNARIVRYTAHKTTWRNVEYATGTVTLYYTGCAKWLDHIEVLYKRVCIFPEGACFNCGQLNHRSKDCGKQEKRGQLATGVDSSPDPVKRSRNRPQSPPPTSVILPQELGPLEPLGLPLVITTDNVTKSDTMETDVEGSSTSDDDDDNPSPVPPMERETTEEQLERVKTQVDFINSLAAHPDHPQTVLRVRAFSASSQAQGLNPHEHLKAWQLAELQMLTEIERELRSQQVAPSPANG